MSVSLFIYSDYRKYLSEVLAPHGAKKKLAEFIPCQSTFLSHVMNGVANLSMEHSLRVTEYLNLNERESDYFMLLVQLQKAGSKSLEKYYLQKIEKIKIEQNRISNQIQEHRTLKLEEQMTFYNSWLYAALHILVAVPEYQSRQALRRYLHLPAEEVDPAIDFMVSHGILQEQSGKLKQGTARMHLPKGSPFLAKHHLNWRMKSLQSFDHEKPQDLHYTVVMSLSEKDVEQMKSIMLDAIKKSDQLLKETGDEVVYTLCMDWFKL